MHIFSYLYIYIYAYIYIYICICIYIYTIIYCSISCLCTIQITCCGCTSMSCILILIAHTHTATTTHTHTQTHTHTHMHTYEIIRVSNVHILLPTQPALTILQMDLFKTEHHEQRYFLSWSRLNEGICHFDSFWLILSDPNYMQCFNLMPAHCCCLLLKHCLIIWSTKSWDHDTWHIDISQFLSNHHTIYTLSRLPPFYRIHFWGDQSPRDSDGLSLSCSICFSSSNRTCSMPGLGVSLMTTGQLVSGARKMSNIFENHWTNGGKYDTLR